MTLVLGVIAARTRSTKTAGRRQRDREGDLLDDDPLAAGALLPARDHPRVVLVGDDDLVAPLQVDAEDQGLHRLGGVAGDGDLLGVAAELAGQVAAHRLDPGLEDPPHVLHGRLVGEPQVADHLVEDVGRRGADPAVVEVDDGAIDVEAALDLPTSNPRRRRARRPGSGRRPCRRRRRGPGRPRGMRRRPGRRRRTGTGQEGASRAHRFTSARSARLDERCGRTGAVARVAGCRDGPGELGLDQYWSELMTSPPLRVERA